MSKKSNSLRIHAQITPEPQPAPEPEQQPVRWKSIPHPKQAQPKERRRKQREKLTFTDRLLRNSAIACALLLGILALGNIDQPWAIQGSDAIERALTMHIDLDESIGRLTFVRNLMPESALVFLNISGDTEIALPAEGELMHAYSDAQPWLTFRCKTASTVQAVSDGIVTAVSTLSGGEIGVLIDHGDNCESVYAYLSECSVAQGDQVRRGHPLGITGDSLYFEMREDGVPIDPSSKMGL